MSNNATSTCTAIAGLYSDSALVAPVARNSTGIYFQAGQCGSTIADDLDNDDNIVFATEVGASPVPIDGIVTNFGAFSIRFSCKYSRILDGIKYEPVGLTVGSSDVTET